MQFCVNTLSDKGKISNQKLKTKRVWEEHLNIVKKES
jgi:hypothetical protein